jgi:protein translocase SecG subunit
MTTLITILILLSAIVMVASIFLQPAKGNGFVGGGSGGAGTQTAMGSSGGTSFMFKVTMWCIGIIMGGSLYLSWHNIQTSKSSVLDTIPLSEVAEPQVPANASPVSEQSAEPEAGQNAPAAPSSSPQNMAPSNTQ